MARALDSPPRTRRQAVLLLWLANIAIAAMVGANWLVHVPRGDEWRLLAFALPALVSTVVVLTAGPGLAFVVASRFVRSTPALGLVQAALWTVFQILLFVDTRIFNAFRYHFNGQVLNILTTRGSEDAVHLGWRVWAAIVLGLALGTLAQSWLWRRSLRYAERHAERRWLRPSLVWAFVLLPAVFVEKTIYAQADLNHDQELTALGRLFPLYARVPTEDLGRVLGVDVERSPRVEVEGLALDYPLERPTVDPDGPRPNVLVLVIDCLRRDMLRPETMPEVSRWAAGARRFGDHASGGNSTRFGLFSLLYGMYGSYWFPVLQARRGPVLIDTLLALDYDVEVFSSASMNYPELRDTAWRAVPDDVHDDFPGAEPWQRDEEAAAALCDWLRAGHGEPFFGFVLLDSPHQPYSFPPADARFRPWAEAVDYLSMTSNEGPDRAMLASVENRYRNAVHHADGVAGRILRTLEESGLAESTLVFVTGDHGEEFRECGFFGHTSAYTPQQIAVPFVARGPGIEPGEEERPTTHLDFPATLLELLGADPKSRAGWTLGDNLLSPPERRERVISGWKELGVWTEGAILRVPLSLLEFDVEVYDYRWRLLDGREILRREFGTLEELGADCNRFLLKPPTR